MLDQMKANAGKTQARILREKLAYERERFIWKENATIDLEKSPLSHLHNKLETYAGVQNRLQ